MSYSGYLLNGERDGFYYLSLSLLHPQRIQANKRLSESTAAPPQQSVPCSAGAQVEDVVLESEAEADSEVDSDNSKALDVCRMYLLLRY